MASGKTFVGSRLRRLRRERGHTQAEMAARLGLSPAYVNLLENNQRSLSVTVLLKLSEAYGVDWRDLLQDDAPARLADLRVALQDPVFAGAAPDIQELRGALDHAPKLVDSFLRLHKSYRILAERALAMGSAGAVGVDQMLAKTPDAAVHDLFRANRNHFDALERAAEGFRAGRTIPPDEIYSVLKTYLKEALDVDVTLAPVDEMPGALRTYDDATRQVRMSEALNHPNRAFQLAHVVGLLKYSAEIDSIVERAKISETRALARCRVELANYFAAAVLTPYAAFLDEAEACRYDLDHLAARFQVSFEQVCHRLTTLQREGRAGVKFFFMRVDKAGNVTKRFNATDFHLAEFGGACPLWDVHLSFRNPGRILPQFVETPDGARYFTINRTVDRPSLGRLAHDQRQAVSLGCAIDDAPRIVYASIYNTQDADIFAPIGFNCRICPRQHCAQRAHQPLHIDLPIDERRRGETRFES